MVRDPYYVERDLRRARNEKHKAYKKLRLKLGVRGIKQRKKRTYSASNPKPKKMPGPKATQKKILNRSPRAIRELEIYFRYGEPELTEFLLSFYTKAQLRIRRLIHLLGGPMKIMEACGVTRAGVSRWVGRERIPVEHWPKLSELAQGKLDVGDIAKIVLSKN